MRPRVVLTVAVVLIVAVSSFFTTTRPTTTHLAPNGSHRVVVTEPSALNQLVELFDRNGQRRNVVRVALFQGDESGPHLLEEYDNTSNLDLFGEDYEGVETVLWTSSSDRCLLVSKFWTLGGIELGVSAWDSENGAEIKMTSDLFEEVIVSEMSRRSRNELLGLARVLRRLRSYEPSRGLLTPTQWVHVQSEIQRKIDGFSKGGS